LEEGGHKIEEESTNFVPDLRKKGIVSCCVYFCINTCFYFIFK